MTHSTKVKMSSRLFNATHSGDTAALQELLKQDPYILHYTSLACSNSPLHVSCLLGHAHYARLVMERNADLARDRNQQGLTPLHLASSKGHLEIVRDLIKIDRETCREEDQCGRIPLHCAAMKGKIDVVRELVLACPETASESTRRGETILHLVVGNNQFKALPPLVGFLRDQNIDMGEFLNFQDEEGQTILHLAVELQNLQMVKFIRSENVDMTVVNSKNLTALDIAARKTITDQTVDSRDIEYVLREGSGNNYRNQDHRIHVIGTTKNQTSSSSSSLSPSQLDVKKDYFTLNAIMVIAVLLATLSFQAALNPPGGVWQDWNNTNTITNTNTDTDTKTKSKRNNDKKVVSPPMRSVALSCLIPRAFNARLKPVRDENKHMPGKSIGRELYTDEYFSFTLSCALCFTFSMITILLTPLVPHLLGARHYLLPSLVAALCCAILSAHIFYRGIALVTDTYVATLVLMSVEHILLFIGSIGYVVLLVVRLKIWKWTSEKIEWCWSRVKSVKWVSRASVEFIVFPMVFVLLAYGLNRSGRSYDALVSKCLTFLQ